MSKNSEKVKRWRASVKSKLIQSMGGCCQICGYDRSAAALEFHHLDPSQKDFSFGGLRASPKAWPSICNEIQKTILLCSNCHKEVHYNGQKIPETFSRFDTRFLDSDFFLVEYSTTSCPVCKKPKLDEATFCSRSCHAKHANTRRKNTN